MIIQIWILCIIFVSLLWFLRCWRIRENFQSESGSVVPTLLADQTRSSFWSILAQQKASENQGSQGSSPIQNLISAVSNPRPTDTFKVTFGKYVSIYALAKYNKNPVAARQALIDNYDLIQNELSTQVKTGPERATQAAFQSGSSTAKTTACNELNTLAMSLYGQVLKVKAAVEDLSGTEILAESLHDENLQFQKASPCTNQGSSPSPACILLASQDETLFPLLPKYDAANINLVTNGQTLQEILNLVLQSYNGMQCPVTDIGSVSSQTIQSVFSPTYLLSLGIINTQSLVDKLEELSPYYVSPTTVGYITRQIMESDEFKANLESTNDYVNNMQKVTNSIVSITNPLAGSGKFYREGPGGGYQTCPAGYYCPPTASFPIPCPVGYYCPPGTVGDLNSNDGTGPIACPEGTFSPVGSSQASNCVSTVPDGYYNNNGKPSICPPGVSCKNGVAVGCPSGQYNPLKGQSVCKNCPAGSYCIPTNVIVGKQTLTGANSATPCPAGKYSNATMQTSLNTCQTCPAGTTCPSKGMAIATPCPAGTYSAVEGLATSCTKGPAGKYSNIAGSTNTSAFITCNAGYYCPAGSSSQQSCPPGSYCPNTGMETPTLCPIGRYGDSINLTSPECSGPCQGGYYCAAGSISAEQSQCPSGFYCSTGGNSVEYPTSCPAGYYCPFGTDRPLPCPPGTFNPGMRGSDLSVCSSCPQGKYCPTGAISVPLVCPIGFYCPSQTSNPIASPAGNYCDRLGMSEPTKCPAGTYNTNTGSTTMVDCRVCGGGYYNPTPGRGESCLSCPTGNYCPNTVACSLYNVNEGTVSGSPSSRISIPIGSTNPIPCPSGTYCDGPNTALPTPCPAGAYFSLQQSKSVSECSPCPSGTIHTKSYITNTSGPGSGPASENSMFQPPISYVSCNTCPSGKYASTDNLSCLTCTPGYKCVGGIQIPCPEGTYSSEGASVCTPTPAGAYSGSQAGSYTICPAGFSCAGGIRVQCQAGTASPERALSCSPCPAGTYSSVGAAVCTPNPVGAYSGSQAGTYKLCEAGYSCTAGLRTECPAGTASGEGATVCSPCPAGEYSSAKAAVCTRVPPGTYSGSQSGSYTTCEGGYSCAGGIRTQCEPGTASPPGSLSCSTCPAGTYSPAGAAGCSASPVGAYSGSRAGTYTICPGGYTCAGGILSPCSPGTFSAAGATVCSRCPAGKYSSSAASFCSDVPTGYYSNSGAASFTICPAGYSCAGGILTLCPGGLYSPIGAIACSPTCPSGYVCTSNGTVTSTRQCAAGYYCSNGLEYRCSPGYFSLPGSIGCSSPCPAGYSCSYSNNGLAKTSTQVQCPIGTYSTGGTLLNNGTTTACSTTLTSFNCSLTCRSCPTGKTSPVGAITVAACV